MTDARALYDASRSHSAGLGLSEKRTAIELSILNERMEAIAAVWKWVDNTKQLADGLTKLQSRQVLADILRCGAHALKFDAVVKAGKKQTQAEKQALQRELDGYANRRKKGRGASSTAAATALIAVASGGRVAQTAVALAALAVADAAELVSYGSCQASEQLGYGTVLKGIVFGILIGVGLATYTWWTCCRMKATTQPQPKATAKPKAKQAPKATRSIMTQSQVTYTRKWSQPRFHPLPDDVQGVAIDL